LSTRSTPPLVAVFGSADPPPDHPAYAEAAHVGALLAARGYGVLTGGYGGVMEGASRGAFEAGGYTRGVTCAVFDDRQPNRWLHEVLQTPDLFVRSRELIEPASGFLVLSGGPGTLAELSLVWALRRAGCLGPRHVVTLGAMFDPLLVALETAGLIGAGSREMTHSRSTPESAVATLDRLIRGTGVAE
jgi:hypothetical protein